MKVPTKGYFRSEENYENSDFQGIFLKQKQRSAAEKDGFFPNKFHISLPCSTSSHLKFFRGKEVQEFSFFEVNSLKQKLECATKAIYVFQRILLYIFWR